MKSEITALKKRYGEDLFIKVSNLYYFCFSDFHSYEVQKIKNKYKKDKAPIAYPFVKNGNKEKAMVFIYFLSKEMRVKNKNFWNDAILVVNFIYYTGFKNDNSKDLNNKLFTILEKSTDITYKSFRESFKFATRFNFDSKVDSTNNYKIKLKLKLKLIDKSRNFKMRFFSNLEKVEKSIEKIMKDGI